MKTAGSTQRGATTTPKAKTARQIAAEKEKAARILAREIKQNESDDRFTHPYLIRAVEKSFGKINFDPCWHPASALRPDRYFNVREGHNGLRDKWSGRIAFVNPPWSLQDKWLKRAYDQWKRGNVETVVCLVPAATDAKFFHETLVKEADVYFLEGRPIFSKPDASSEQTMRVTMIVIFGANPEQKVRFADEVQGSWLRPEHVARDRRIRPRSGSGGLIHYYGTVSCAAAVNRIHRHVTCRPSSGLSQAT